MHNNNNNAFEVLITFNSTTATFKADKCIKEKKKDIKYDIISIPYKLTDTCFGIGINLICCSKQEVIDIYDLLLDEKIDFKHFWKKDNKNNSYMVYEELLKK